MGIVGIFDCKTYQPCSREFSRAFLEINKENGNSLNSMIRRELLLGGNELKLHYPIYYPILSALYARRHKLPGNKLSFNDMILNLASSIYSSKVYFELPEKLLISDNGKLNSGFKMCTNCLTLSEEYTVLDNTKTVKFMKDTVQFAGEHGIGPKNITIPTNLDNEKIILTSHPVPKSELTGSSFEKWYNQCKGAL